MTTLLVARQSALNRKRDELPLSVPRGWLHDAVMRLEMATEEAQELKWALDVRLIEMRGELARTSAHAYRDELRIALLRVEGVVRRLAKALEESKGEGLPEFGKTVISATNVQPEK